MRPLIRPQALIVVRPADPAALVPGQIVVFRREDRFLAHRVIAVRQAPDGARQLLEKGDNQACASWIAAQDAIGVAVSMRDPVDERRLEVDGRERRIRPDHRGLDDRMRDSDPPDEIRLTCHGCLLARPDAGNGRRPDGARGQIPVSGGIVAGAEG